MCKAFITYLLSERFAINTLSLSRYICHELLRSRALVSLIFVPWHLIQGLAHVSMQLVRGLTTTV